MPIFTKWVIENPDELVAAFAYDILFLLVNLSFILLTLAVISKEAFKDLHIKNHEAKQKDERFIVHLIVMTFIVLFLLVISILISEILIVLFIGFHIVISLSNLIGEDKGLKYRGLMGKFFRRILGPYIFTKK
jgi:uncharacterized membrane protein